MNLQFKPILWLVSGIVVMFALSLTIQLYRNNILVQRLADENNLLIEKSEWKNAENVFLTTENAVKGSLERGEMQKFIKVLASQRSVKGMLEFSLFNPEGVVTHSSDSANVSKSLAPEVRTALTANAGRFERCTNGAFEIYDPLAISADCLRCHTTWQAGHSGGVLMCRFSTDSLAEARRTSAASLAGIKTSQITNGSLTTFIIAGIFVVLAVYVVRKQIMGPLVHRLESPDQRVQPGPHLLATDHVRQPIARGRGQPAGGLAGGNQRLLGRAFLDDQEQRGQRPASRGTRPARPARGRNRRHRHSGHEPGDG